MRKTQGLPLNLIVIGALALLVLMILGGVLIMGGGSMMEGLTGAAPSEEEVALQSLLTDCQSKCRTAKMMVDDIPPTTVSEAIRLQDFCCHGSDIDGNGEIDYNSETCAAVYTDCRIGGLAPSGACASGTTPSWYCRDTISSFSSTTAYDFTTSGSTGTAGI